jgi:hypothetical protein
MADPCFPVPARLGTARPEQLVTHMRQFLNSSHQ